MAPIEGGPAANRRGTESWLTKGLFEGSLIVFSVLLALSVDSWRDGAEGRRRLAEAKRSVLLELQFNRELLAKDDYAPFHKRLLAVYVDQMRQGHIDRADALMESGVHVALLRNVAWESLANTPLSAELPFGDRMAIAYAYQEQDGLARMHASALAAFMVPNAERELPAFKRDQVRTIALYLSDVVAAEERLLVGYDQAIRRLAASAHTAPAR